MSQYSEMVQNEREGAERRAFGLAALRTEDRRWGGGGINRTKIFTFATVSTVFQFGR